MYLDNIPSQFIQTFSLSEFELDPQVIEIEGREYELEETRDLKVFTSDIDDNRYGYFEWQDAEGYRYSVFCKVTVDPETWEASVSDFHRLEKSEYSVYDDTPRLREWYK